MSAAPGPRPGLEGGEPACTRTVNDFRQALDRELSVGARSPVPGAASRRAG
jgi:hypothetical protein